MDRDSVLHSIDQAFGDLPRPAVMVRNPRHCDECADHEATMQAVTPQNVTMTEIGSPAWDPVCFLSDEAFCYFMPGFARLVLDDDYLDQLLFHLDQGFRTDILNAQQRRAVMQLLDYTSEIMLETIYDYRLENTWDRVRSRLADLDEGKPV